MQIFVKFRKNVYPFATALEPEESSTLYNSLTFVEQLKLAFSFSNSIRINPQEIHGLDEKLAKEVYILMSHRGIGITYPQGFEHTLDLEERKI